MRPRYLVLAALLTLATFPLLAPGAQATHYCPTDQTSSRQLESSQYDSTAQTSFTVTNTGSSNVTFDGSHSIGTYNIDTSTSASEPAGAIIEPGESVTVDVSATIDPAASEGSHTIDVTIEMSGGDCNVDWDLTVIKDPILDVEFPDDGSSLDLGDIFKGDTPSEGTSFPGLSGNVVETTGFDGVTLGSPTVDCGDLSPWVSLRVSGWPTAITASGEKSFSATLRISADAPYDQVRGERIDCDISSEYSEDGGGGVDTVTGSVQGTVLWPAMLGAVATDPVEISFDEPIEDPPQTFRTNLTATVANMGDEPMRLQAGTHALTPNARVEILRPVDLPARDGDRSPEEMALAAELQLDAPIDEGKHNLTGGIQTPRAGTGDIAVDVQIHQPEGLRVEPTDINWTGTDAVEVGSQEPLPLRVFETYGYNAIESVYVEPVELDQGSLPEGAQDVGDTDWIPRAFGPRTLPPGAPYAPEGEDLETSVRFLPGAKPGCAYGFRFRVVGEGVEPVTLDIVAEPTQPDRDAVLSDLRSATQDAGPNASAALERFEKAQADLAIDAKEACQAPASLVADNQRLLTVAKALTTFFSDGVGPAEEALSGGEPRRAANHLASASSAVSVIRRQAASMSGESPGAVSAVEEIKSLLAGHLRDRLATAASSIYCEADTCEHALSTHISAGRMLAQAAGIAGLPNLHETYAQEAESLDREHRDLVKDAFSRFREGDEAAEDARQDHLIHVGDSGWLINPFRYGFYMGSIDEAEQNLRTARDEFRILGDGSMVAASSERLIEIQQQRSTAQNSFFTASFFYLGLFGLLVFHLIRSTQRYRHEVEDAELGGFLRITQAPPLASSTGGFAAVDLSFSEEPEPTPEGPMGGPGDAPGVPEPEVGAGTAGQATAQVERQDVAQGADPSRATGPVVEGEPEVVWRDE